MRYLKTLVSDLDEQSTMRKASRGKHSGLGNKERTESHLPQDLRLVSHAYFPDVSRP